MSGFPGGRQRRGCPLPLDLPAPLATRPRNAQAPMMMGVGFSA